MKKNFYIVYGNKSKDLCFLAKYISDKFGLIFELRDSSYIGEYYIYKGIHADKILLEYNYNKIEKSYMVESNKEFSIIINIAIYNGKNKDKESKCKYIKSLFDKNDDFVFISEKIIQED